MSDIIEYIKSWSALKWVILVLIAGFIGQFGRMTAEAIVKKIRQRNAQKENLSARETKSAVSSSTAVTDKKLIKAMAKARKKEAKKK
jgi:hypothetical protein